MCSYLIYIEMYHSLSLRGLTEFEKIRDRCFDPFPSKRLFGSYANWSVPSPVASEPSIQMVLKVDSLKPAASASPGSFLEIQNLRLHSRLTKLCVLLYDG